MAIGVYFPFPSMSAENMNDEGVRRLAEAGLGAPSGRLYHVAFEAGSGVHVFDVWDSQESFDAFGRTLMPIMNDLGVDAGEPQISQVRNIIQG